MNTAIKLERRVELAAWNITGTVAFAVKRDWEPAMLKLALQYGAISPQTVASELLGGRTGVAERLIAICTSLGLLSRGRDEWTLTDEGRTAAQNGTGPRPRAGSVDCLGHGGSGGARQDPGRRAMARPTGLRGTQRQGHAEDLRPAEVATRTERQGLPARRRRGAVPSNRRLRPQGARRTAGRRGELRATLLLGPDGNRLRLKGKLGERAFESELPPPSMSHAEASAALLRGAGLQSQWNPHRRALWVSFAQTAEHERASMQRSITFTTPELPGLGQFDNTTVPGVALYPNSRTDASEWADWRLVQRLQTYVVGDQYDQAWRAAVAPFDELAPPKPDRAVLAARMRGNGRPRHEYWRLQAPTDWLLEGRKAS